MTLVVLPVYGDLHAGATLPPWGRVYGDHSSWVACWFIVRIEPGVEFQWFQSFKSKPILNINQTFYLFYTLAQRLVPAVVDSYNAVYNEWRETLRIITDISLPMYICWATFDKMMFAWFLNDKHYMCWDRIVMVNIYYIFLSYYKIYFTFVCFITLKVRIR